MAIDLRISTGSDTPIYRQIFEQVVRAVADGRLAVGEQMPSIRSLAESLVVNPNTVARAYADLARDGILDGHHGRGVYVAARRQVLSREERARRLSRAVEVLVCEAVSLGSPPAEVRRAVEEGLSALERPVQGGKGKGGRDV